MFGDKLKKIRAEKELTQKQLAELLGLSEGAIGMYETNKRTPDLESIKEIARKLEVHPAYFLDEPKSVFTVGELKDKVPAELHELISSEYKDVIELVRDLKKEDIPAEHVSAFLKTILETHKHKTKL